MALKSNRIFFIFKDFFKRKKRYWSKISTNFQNLLNLTSLQLSPIYSYYEKVPQSKRSFQNIFSRIIAQLHCNVGVVAEMFDFFSLPSCHALAFI